MAVERTYLMLKPDCIQRGLMGEVIARIERKGYKIVDAKMMNLDEAILREHYAHIADKPFFPRSSWRKNHHGCYKVRRSYSWYNQR